jgi:hypothetical protein
MLFCVNSSATVSVNKVQAVQAALSRLAAMPARARSTALLLLTASGSSICCCTLSSQPAVLLLVCCMRCSCGSGGGGSLRGIPLLPLALSTNAAVVVPLLLLLRVLTPACVCSCSAW